MTSRSQIFSFALLALATTNCAVCGALDSGAPTNAVTRCENTALVPTVAKTDILFVIDDSPSMSEEQQDLADNFDAFINRLANTPVKNEYQIGVTTSSVFFDYQSPTGDRIIQDHFDIDPNNPNSGAHYPQGALVALDAQGKYVEGEPKILKAGEADLVARFSRYARVGTFGSGQEQPLLAARLALTDRLDDGTNPNFLREGAKLAVIIVSDEDDCSDPDHQIWYQPGLPDACHEDAAKAKLEPVQDFVTFLKTKLGGREVVVGVIAPVNADTKQPEQCGTAYGVGARYRTFVDGFGSKGLIDSICNASFRSTLEQIAGLIDPGQTLDLSQPPADGRLLVVTLAKADGRKVSCKSANESDSDAAKADILYHPPRNGKAASVTFQNACHLDLGDHVNLQLICAG